MPIEDVEPRPQAAHPAIVMVATGMKPATLVLPAHAELGRRIAAAGGCSSSTPSRTRSDHQG